MRPARRWAATLASVLPAGWLSPLSGIRTLMPYHHTVSDERLPHIRNLYAYKGPGQFEADLDWMLRRYRPLHPNDLAAAVEAARPLPPRTFLLSFDDGFRELHDVVAPILLRKGVPALFFLNPAFLDNKELFYRCKLSLLLEKAQSDTASFHALAAAAGLEWPSYKDLRAALLSIHYPDRARADEWADLLQIDFNDYLRTQRPFLTTAQVQHLDQQGFCFGGHSIDHPAYRHLPLDEQLRQTTTSLSEIDRIAPGARRFFAFPHEDAPVPQPFFDRIKTKGNPLLFGLQNAKDEAHNRTWHRYNAEDPAHPLSARTGLVQLYNAALRMMGGRTVKRKGAHGSAWERMGAERLTP